MVTDDPLRTSESREGDGEQPAVSKATAPTDTAHTDLGEYFKTSSSHPIPMMTSYQERGIGRSFSDYLRGDVGDNKIMTDLLRLIDSRDGNKKAGLFDFDNRTNHCLLRGGIDQDNHMVSSFEHLSSSFTMGEKNHFTGSR